MKIICLDDEVNFLEMIQFKINKLFGNNPTTFTDVDSTLNYLKENTVDLILCDYNLGNERFGTEVIEYLMQQENQKPYFILMTAEGNPDMFEKSSKYKKFRFVQKLTMQGNDLENVLKEIKKEQLEYRKEDNYSAIGEMMNNITHEIKNPLTVIGMQVFALKNQLEGADEEEKQEVLNSASGLLDSIKSNTHLVNEIINDVKNMSSDHVQLEEFSLNEVYNQLTDFMEDKVDVNIDLEAFNSEKQIYFNKTQFLQVIFNLLNNSYDAVSDLEERWISIKVEEKESEMVVKVIDSGSGINEYDRGMIFNKSYSKKKNDKGTGCGLYLTKKYLNNADGEIFVDSEAPNTTFVLKFPKKAS